MDKKISSIFIFALLFFFVLVVGIIVFIIFSGGDEDDVSTKTEEVATETPKSSKIEAVIPEVEKDSILKSTDSGLSFETYFKIQTNTELGAVDVLGITFHPEVKDRIIVSTYDDGLFYNENGVNRWKVILFPPQKIYSFILDKVDPDNRSFASGVTSGNGRIFRTENGGGAWRVVYAEPGTNTTVTALTQDPADNNIIIAGTSAGTLIRSVDRGDTWKNIGQKITGSISMFAHDSTKSSVTYLLMNGGKVYHSYDAGQTWLNWEEEKAKEIKSLNDSANQLSKNGNKAGADSLRNQVKAIQQRNTTEKTPSGIIKIVADPSRTGVLYASLSNGLYRSTDYGKYWKKINIIESAEKFPILSVAVNPDNSDEISFVSGNTFYRSINYGSTWSVTPLDKTRNASFVAYDPFNPTTIFIGLSAKK